MKNIFWQFSDEADRWVLEALADRTKSIPLYQIVQQMPLETWSFAGHRGNVYKWLAGDRAYLKNRTESGTRGASLARRERGARGAC